MLTRRRQEREVEQEKRQDAGRRGKREGKRGFSRSKKKIARYNEKQSTSPLHHTRGNHEDVNKQMKREQKELDH